jgi:hypothetical protein
MVRRVIVLLAATLVLGALGLLAAAPTAATGAERTIVFGAAQENRTAGQSRLQAIQDLERSIGRPLAAVRNYYLWNATFPTADDRTLRDTGHTIYMSVKARMLNGTAVSWRSIADAAVGTARYNEIVSWADRVRAFGAPVVFTFNHEPEAATNRDLGTNVDFIDAWRRIISVFRARGVANATYAWIMTDYSFEVQDRRAAHLWYPGDEWIDAIGVDAYNWYRCRPNAPIEWRSLARTIEPMRQFARNHPNEQLMVTEYGTVEDPAVPGRKAQWFDDARALFAQPGYERFTAVLYFNILQSSFPDCRWFVDSSESSLSAFARMGNDPLYGGTAAPPPPPPPPSNVVFSDSFDQGLGAWSSVTRVTVDSTRGNAAAPSARLTAAGNTAFARRGFGSGRTQVCAAANALVGSVTSADFTLLRVREAGGAALARVYVRSDRRLVVRADVVGTTFTTTASLPASTWRRVELCITVGSAGTLRLLVDGAEVGSWTANTGTSPATELQIGDNAAKTADVWLDDVRVTSG